MNPKHEPARLPEPARNTELKPLSDEDLIALVRAKSHDAMTLLFDRYRRLVQTVASRILRDSGEAEDLVQSVFLEIFQSAFQFDAAKGSARVWILQYAYHRSLNRKEYLNRRGIYNGPGQLVRESTPDAVTGSLLRLESAQFVREAFGYLTGAERKIITLAFYEGLTMHEAAERTGDSFDSVRHHFYRGMRKLRSIFSEVPDSRLETSSKRKQAN